MSMEFMLIEAVEWCITTFSGMFKVLMIKGCTSFYGQLYIVYDIYKLSSIYLLKSMVLCYLPCRIWKGIIFVCLFSFHGYTIEAILIKFGMGRGLVMEKDMSYS